MIPTMSYTETVEALHRLSVYVISPAQRLVNGEIVLRSLPGGFGTHPFGDGTVVRVDGADLVVDRTGGSAREPITTLAAAACLVGVEPDLAQQEQFDVPAAGDLDEPLAIEPAAVAELADWYALVTAALEQLRAEAGPADDVSPVRIWPEHFDCAIDLGDAGAGTRGTYGGSPGDGHHGEPYVYASPWAGRIDPFFDDPSFNGASRTAEQLAAGGDPQAAAVEFLREARGRIGGFGS